MSQAVFINGSQVSASPSVLTYTENASGRCDTLFATFPDASGELGALGIEKGQEMEAVSGSIETGRMYISEVQWGGGAVSIKAASAPGTLMEQNASWEKASFGEIIKDIAEEAGLALSVMHPLDVHYESVARLEMPPLEFLHERLLLESYAFRVRDGSIEVYDERIAENAQHEQQLWTGDFLKGLSCLTSDAGLVAAVYNSCLTSDGRVIQTYVQSGLPGKTLRRTMTASSIDESERFSKGVMRAANKNEFITEGAISGLDYRAGQTVWLVDAPHGHDGLNYVQRIQNDLIGGTQALSMRKPIAGGY